MTSFKLSTLSVLFLSSLFAIVQSNCPDHCVICLNALWLCNRWKSSYDLSNHDDIAVINSNAFINADQAINIDISTNLISTLETNAFVGLNSLQVLNLSHNLISVLPDGIFSPLTNLRTLDLSHNIISHLNPTAFANLTNLNNLYLSSNQFSSSYELTTFINQFPSLRNITLSGNNWYCDCNTSDVQYFLLHSSLVIDSATMTCHSPSSLANSLVINLNFYIDPLCFSMSPTPSPSFSSSLSHLSSTYLSFSPSPSFLFSSSAEIRLSSSLLSSKLSLSSLFVNSLFISSTINEYYTPSLSFSSFPLLSPSSLSSSIFTPSQSSLYLTPSSSTVHILSSVISSPLFTPLPSLSTSFSSFFSLPTSSFLSPSQSSFLTSSPSPTQPSLISSSSFSPSFFSPSSFSSFSSSPSPSLSNSLSLSSSPFSSSSSLSSTSFSSSIFSSPSPSSSPSLSSSPSSISSSPSSSSSPSLSSSSSSISSSPSPSSSSLSVTTSPSFLSISPSSSRLFITPTSTYQPVEPSPTPQCPTVTTQSDIGSLEWPVTLAGHPSQLKCPYGPSGAEALRFCVQTPNRGALWGAVQDGACFTVDNRLQQLMFQDITASNVVSLSEEIANMPFGHLSSDGLNLFVDIAERIMNFGQSSITVVVNVLSAIDLLLASDDSQMLQSSHNAKLQSLVNTALLNAVNVNRTQLILQFSRLFIGAKYTTETQVQVEVEMQGEGRLSFVPNNQIASGELVIEVDIQSDELQGHTVQVTILNNDSVLYSTGCLMINNEQFCNVQVISPIAVTSVSGSRLNDERVNVTFENINYDPESVLYCAMWNGNISDPQNNGREMWDTAQCHEILLNDNTILCSCTMTGAVGVIQALLRNITITPPTEINPTSSAYNTYVIWIFYILSGVSILLHLPVIITAIRISYKYDYVRNIQALSHHGITQMFVLILTTISFQRTEVRQLCLTFGSLLHYVILVSYLWLIIRTIVLCMSQVRYKKLYEKDCFILPFFFVAWSLPIVPIVVYGVLAFTNTDKYTIENCWIESFVFPNYFIYLVTICSVLLISIILVTGPVMACSSFVIMASSYYQLFGLFIEAILFSGIIGLLFATATVASNQLLVVLSSMIFIGSVYFFVSNGLIRPIVRRNIICRPKKTGYEKGRPYSGQETPTTVSSMSQVSKRLRELRAHRIRQNDEMNLDYIGGYLGYPLGMWTEVGEGKRIRKKGFFNDEYTRGSSEA